MRSLPAPPRCHPLLRSPRRAAGGRAKRRAAAVGPLRDPAGVWRGGGHPGPNRASDTCRPLEGPSLGLTSSRQGLRGVLAEAGAHLGSLRPDTEGTQIGERSVSNLRALGSPECDCGEGPCSFGALPRRLLPDCPGGGVGEGEGPGRRSCRLFVKIARAEAAGGCLLRKGEVRPSLCASSEAPSPWPLFCPLASSS